MSEKRPIFLAIIAFGITPAEVKQSLSHVPEIQAAIDNEDYHHLDLGDDITMDVFSTAVKLTSLHERNPHTILLASGGHHKHDEHEEMLIRLEKRFVDSRILDIPPGGDQYKLAPQLS